MSLTYRVTLLQLKGDLSAVAGPTDKLDLGLISAEEVVRLAGKLQYLDHSANPKAEPALLVRRGERGSRISAHKGKLRFYEGTSPLDDYRTLNSPQELLHQPLFHQNEAGYENRTGAFAGVWRVVRSLAEVGALLVIGVVLIAAGLWFGMPHRKLSELPDDIVVVSGQEEKQAIFAAVAGTYETGKRAGDDVVSIGSDGRVTRIILGRDNKPLDPARNNEVARAGRRGQTPVVITSFGIIALNPPDSVKWDSRNVKRQAAK